MIEKSLVQNAINNLIQEGCKITVASTRRKLIELNGYAGNNNDLAPLVKQIKKELKDQSKGEDIDETIAIAIQNSTTIDMPAELESNAIKFVRYLYEEIYNTIDSEVDNDRIQQLEQENEILRNQNTEYPKLKMELEVVQKYYYEANQKLIETNRLLDLQKVANGEEKVEEFKRIQELYEEASNEVANLKTTAQYATERKSEFSRINADLREQIEAKDNRIAELEQAVITLSEANNDNNSTQREEFLENRMIALTQELDNKNERLKQVNAEAQELKEQTIYLQHELEDAKKVHENIDLVGLEEFREELHGGLADYIEELGLTEEINRNKSKVAKFINGFFDKYNNNLD